MSNPKSRVLMPEAGTKNYRFDCILGGPGMKQSTAHSVFLVKKGRTPGHREVLSRRGGVVRGEENSGGIQTMDISKWIRALGRALSLVLIVVLTVGFGAGCRKGDEGGENGDGGDSEQAEAKKDKDGEDGEDGDEEGEEEEEAVPVALAALGRGTIEAVLRFSTNLEAESQVQVLSESSREVRQLLVEEGDKVKRGHVLIRLEDDEQRTELERIEGQLSKAERELTRRQSLFEHTATECHAFDVCVSPERENFVQLYEVYSARNVFDAHLNSLHFHDFNNTVQSWVSEKNIFGYNSHRVHNICGPTNVTIP